MKDDIPGAKEVIAVAGEEGVVLTGTGIAILESRLLQTLRKPFYMLFALMGLVFVILLGGSVFLTRLDDTVHNTDRIVTEVAGPEARKASAKNMAVTINALVDGLDCRDQNNLQRLLDQLSAKGFTPLAGINVIKPPCTKIKE